MVMTPSQLAQAGPSGCGPLAWSETDVAIQHLLFLRIRLKFFIEIEFPETNPRCDHLSETESKPKARVGRVMANGEFSLGQIHPPSPTRLPAESMLYSGAEKASDENSNLVGGTTWPKAQPQHSSDPNPRVLPGRSLNADPRFPFLPDQRGHRETGAGIRFSKGPLSARGRVRDGPVGCQVREPSVQDRGVSGCHRFASGTIIDVVYFEGPTISASREKVPKVAGMARTGQPCFVPTTYAGTPQALP